MAFTVNPETGRIEFGVVSDGTNDAISIDFASQFGVSEDFKDNFTLGGADFGDDFFNASNWIGGTAGRTEITGGALEYTFENGGDDTIYHDQGSGMVSDTEWVLRTKIVIDTSQNPNTGTTHGGIVVSDAIANLDTVQNAIAFRMLRNVAGARSFRVCSTVGTVSTPTNDVLFTTLPDAGTYYMELKRTSETKVIASLFSDATYETLIEKQDVIASSAQSSLRYISVSNRTGVAQTTPAFIGRFDDLSFYNGITPLLWTPSTLVTDPPRNIVNTSTGVMDWDGARDGDRHINAFDLGAGNVSETSWMLRFKITIDTLVVPTGTNMGVQIGLRDVDETIDNVSTVTDYLNCSITNPTAGGALFRVRSGNGEGYTGGTQTTFTTVPSLGTYYFELIRNSAILGTLNIYSDAEYTSLIESNTVVMSAGIANLRYISVSGLDTNTTTSGSFTGTIDDMQFWNGKTVPTISSTNWRLRYKLDITNLDDGANAVDKTLFFGLGDSDGLSASSALQDGYFLRTITNNVSTDFEVLTPDNEAPRTKVADVVMTTTPSVSTFFVEMVRDSASQTTFNFYTDGTYVTLVETQTQAGVSGSDNLKYLKAFNDNVASASGAIDGSIDDITFTDLIGAPATPAMEKTFFVNALLKGAQIKEFLVDAFIKQLGVNGCGEALFSDEFASDNWGDQGTKILVNTGTQVIDVDGSMDGLLHATAFDLMTPVSDASFNLRFKLSVTSTAFTSSNLNINIGLFDTDETSPSASGGDAITIEYNVQNTTGTRRYVSRALEGASSFGNSAFFSGFGLATHWIEIIRNSTTSVTLNVFSDSSFTTQIGTTTFAIPATLGGLQYIKVRNNDTTALGGTLIATIDDVLLNGINLICPSPTVNAILQLQDIDKEFFVDAILELAQMTCSPWKKFDEADGSSVRVTINQGDAQGYEIPPVTVPTQVTGIKTSVNSTSSQGSVSMRIVNFPQSQLAQGNFATIANGSSTNQVNMSALTGSFSDFTFTFNGAVLQPGSRYMIVFDDQIGNGTGMFYETIAITTKDYAEYAVTYQDPGSGSPAKYARIINRANAPAVDIEVANEGMLACVLVDALLEAVDAWEFREQRYSNANLINPPDFTLGTEPTRLKVSAPTGSDGRGWIFKSFKKTDITGSSILIEGDGLQETRIRVYDGQYKRQYFGDFEPAGDINDPVTPLDGIGLLGSISANPLTTSLLLPAGSINYAGSTEDFITVMISCRQAVDTNIAELELSAITISPFLKWNFVNPTVVTEETGNGGETDWGYTRASSTQIPFMEHEFLIDACIGLFGGFSRSRIGDIIILCLRAFPLSTGLEVVAHVNTYTQANGLPFLGKTSRVKNWLGFLEAEGLIEEDDSDPSWYKTRWSSLI